MTLLAPVLATAAAFGVGALAYLWRERLGRRGVWPALLRGGAGALLAFLLIDLTCAPGRLARPLVLLDGSLSMDAAGGQGRAARDSAARWGEVRYFGADATGPDTAPGFARSTLRTALIAATSQGRPVIIVSDGAVEDLGELPADLLARTTVRLFPRDPIADAAVLRVDAPAQVTLGDTVPIDITVAATGGIGAKGTLELTEAGGRRILSRPVSLAPGGTRVTLEAPSRLLGAGDHLLTVRIAVPGDQEPHDDPRELLVRVTPLPGAVLLAAPPDWDARALYATLRDVAALPVKGFVRLGPAGWRSMDGLHPVHVEEVARAARGAVLLVVKGAPEVVPAGAHPRGLWRWPSGEGGESVEEGDWYLTLPGGASPIANALSGVIPDSLPPLARLTPITPGAESWVGLSAQLGRRGAPRPVIFGRDSAGLRVLTVAGDGLWRIGFRPGSGEEAYRELVAASVDWLLGGSDSLVGVARPARRVVPFGAPVVFERTDTAAIGASPVTFTGDPLTRTDTLTFDGAGRATVRLPPGRYAYRFARGGQGVVAVDRWSEEYVPKAPSLRPQVAAGTVEGARTSLRDRWWVYALIVALLAAEWGLRRRMGLR